MHWYNGSLIALRRKEKGWTQQNVSSQIGLSRNQIIAMEKGRFTGGIKYLRKYLDLLGLKVTIIENQTDLPQLNELANIFKEDE
ncbi:MAG: helix-turn-helix transcriptional regulator [Alteromonadaceae bacterium]|nr:helix-turn-helix transcriptional regulator [Alteromonadaceae bacterium]